MRPLQITELAWVPLRGKWTRHPDRKGEKDALSHDALFGEGKFGNEGKGRRGFGKKQLRRG